MKGFCKQFIKFYYSLAGRWRVKGVNNNVAQKTLGGPVRGVPLIYFAMFRGLCETQINISVTL